MRQKVVIRAIVHQEDRILLLRRHGGRPSINGLYELPGGSLHHGEQPSDALKRSLQIHAGIAPESYKLRDVTSFVDPDFREMQYVFVVFDVTLPRHPIRLTLDDEYDHYVWRKLSNIQLNLLTHSTSIVLNLPLSGDFPDDLVLDSTKNIDEKTTLFIHSDGGSRGNPGPSASAYIIMDKNENIVAQGGKFLGFSDSAIAEYEGVRLGLEKAAELGAQQVEFYSDSLMVVNHLNGILRVKNDETRPIYNKIVRLMTRFRRINFRHVHREYNRMADGLVNKILDENT